MTNILEIQQGAGVLIINDAIFVGPGVTKSVFANNHKSDLVERVTGPGYTLFDGMEVNLFGKRFQLGVRFFEEKVHSIAMTWLDGRVAALGYDADEKDLLDEKKRLTTVLSKNMNVSPSRMTLGADHFHYSWGEVVSVANLKSTWCGVEIGYEA